MEVNVLASGSLGNCYKISDGHSSLLLECGIPIKKIREGLGFRLSGIDACLVTHEHQDHCKAVKDIMKAGIDVYMSTGTKEALGLYGHRIKEIRASAQFSTGTFIILPFDVEHDCREPLGYLVYSTKTGEKLLFATDTYYLRYRFEGLTHIMVECNYSKDTLDMNLPKERYQRLIKSHMNLGTCKEFLRANDLGKVNEIYLLHLSDYNSDAARFKREIQELTGRQVIVAG